MSFFLKRQGAGRAKTGTGAAMNAFVCVLAHTFRKRLDFQSHFFQKANTAVEIFLLSAELQNNDALAPGVYSGFKDIENKIVLLGKQVMTGCWTVSGV